MISYWLTLTGQSQTDEEHFHIPYHQKVYYEKIPIIPFKHRYAFVFFVFFFQLASLIAVGSESSISSGSGGGPVGGV